MSEDCKTITDMFPFVVEALKVHSMTLSVVHKKEGFVKLDASIIPSLLKFSTDTTWEQSDAYSVIIRNPQYIGYRLGSLRTVDDGIAIHRSSQIDSKKIFMSLTL